MRKNYFLRGRTKIQQPNFRPSLLGRGDSTYQQLSIDVNWFIHFPGGDLVLVDWHGASVGDHPGRKAIMVERPHG